MNDNLQYCPNHQLISHSIDHYFVLKWTIQDLIVSGIISLPDDSIRVLKNIIANKVGKIDHIPWNAVTDSQSDANLGATTHDDANVEVTLINVGRSP